MRALRILETAQGIMGPFAGSLFVREGAEVIKCEPPHGDWTRHVDALAEQRTQDGGVSGVFLSLNRGKRSVTLNTADHAGRTLFKALVRWADVLLCGPELREAGIDDATLGSWNPLLIRGHVSTFGLSGPYRDLSTGCIQVLALGGIMGITGDPRREPLQLPGHHPEYIGGIHAFTAVSASLLRRARFLDGRGERVEISAFEAVAASAEMVCTLYTYTGAVRSRFQGRQPWGIQGEVVPCKDGYIAVHPGTMDTLAILIGRPDLATDPLFTDAVYRLRHADQFLALLRPYLTERTRREIISECEALRIPFGAVLEVPELLGDEQLIARQFFEEVNLNGTTIRLSGGPYRVSGREFVPGPPPALGEGNAELFAALAGVSTDYLATLEERGVV